MSIIGILKIMEVQEDDMEVQEEAVFMDSSFGLFLFWSAQRIAQSGLYVVHLHNLKRHPFNLKIQICPLKFVYLNEPFII